MAVFLPEDSSDIFSKKKIVSKKYSSSSHLSNLNVWLIDEQIKIHTSLTQYQCRQVNLCTIELSQLGFL